MSVRANGRKKESWHIRRSGEEVGAGMNRAGCFAGGCADVQGWMITRSTALAAIVVARLPRVSFAFTWRAFQNRL